MHARARFAGEGNCSVCHFGPRFSNGEFADTGVPFFAARGRVDSGRHGGIRKLKESPYNLLGRFNDDRSRASVAATRHVEAQHRNFGEFRVPALRDVVRFYSELNEERLHADGERVLKPLRLNREEIDDLSPLFSSPCRRVK